MNLYEMLHKDHERVREIFSQLERTTESDDTRREHLFMALHRELEVHARAEEKFLYGRLKGEDLTRELVLESLDEHKEVGRMLDELASMDKGSSEWTLRLRACREAVDRHVEEEENELFPRARKTLDEEEADGIAEDMEAFREEHTELEAY